MRKKSLQRIFAKRSQDAVRLLIRLPLSDVNRPAVESAARKASLDALLAANPRLVQACHDISVLASKASGPGIPEGPARLRCLRAALRRAQWTALRGDDWADIPSAATGTGRRKTKGKDFPGSPYAQTLLVRGRIAVPASLLERVKSLGTGLRLLRFRPEDLRKSPQELSDRLSGLESRGLVLGLFAVTGRKTGSAAREFLLFTPDYAPESGRLYGEADPLKGFPASGLIRTLHAAGTDSGLNLKGLELVSELPSWELNARSAKSSVSPETVSRDESLAGVPAGGAAGGIEKFAKGSAAERAVRAGAALDGEYRNATVLYADLASFLSASRGSSPVLAAELLNLILSRFSRGVEAFGGVVDAFVGSALYAYWGAPSATGRDAAAAADAALAMRQALLAFNRDRTASGKPAVRMICGLDSSPVLAGRIGSSKRISYTVAGEASRRACQIGATNEFFGSDILVSDYTMRLMGNSFLTSPMAAGGMGVEGTRAPIHALLGRRGDPACPRDMKDLRKLLGSA